VKKRVKPRKVKLKKGVENKWVTKVGNLPKTSIHNSPNKKPATGIQITIPTTLEFLPNIRNSRRN
jgi:hypothetical protein